MLFAGTVLLLQFAGSSADLHKLLHGHGDRAPSCSHHEGPCNSNSDNAPDKNACNSSCAVVLLSGGLTLDKSFEPLPVQRHLLAIHVDWTTDKPVQALEFTNEARAPPVL